MSCLSVVTDLTGMESLLAVWVAHLHTFTPSTLTQEAFLLQSVRQIKYVISLPAIFLKEVLQK
jgi:hypothetical protein